MIMGKYILHWVFEGLFIENKSITLILMDYGIVVHYNHSSAIAATPNFIICFLEYYRFIIWARDAAKFTALSSQKS